MGRKWIVFVHYPCFLFKPAKVTLPKHLRVNLSFMPLYSVKVQLHTETVSPIPFEMQTTSVPSTPPSSQADRLSTLIKSVSQWISGLERLLYSTNNQVQMCLITIKTQLDAIQQKLEDSL